MLVGRTPLRKSSLGFILISALSLQRISRWGDSELGYFFPPLPDGLQGFSSAAFSLGLSSADAPTPAGVSSVLPLAGRRLPHAPSLPGAARAARGLEGAVLLRPWHHSNTPAEIPPLDEKWRVVIKSADADVSDRRRHQQCQLTICFSPPGF